MINAKLKAQMTSVFIVSARFNCIGVRKGPSEKLSTYQRRLPNSVLPMPIVMAAAMCIICTGLIICQNAYADPHIYGPADAILHGLKRAKFL